MRRRCPPTKDEMEGSGGNTDLVARWRSSAFCATAVALSSATIRCCSATERATAKMCGQRLRKWI